jgi:hypothetical protein
MSNTEKRKMITDHLALSRKYYFEKYPHNGITVKHFWNKCRVKAAKQMGIIK